MTALLDQLRRGEDADARAGAADELAELRIRRQEVTDALVAATKDAESEVRAAAARALGHHSDVGPEVLAAFHALMTDEDPAVALTAMGWMPRFGPPSVSLLRTALRHADPDVRHAAAEILQTWGRSALGALDDLLDLLNDPEDLVRSVAARTIGDLGPAALSAAPHLSKLAAEDPEEWVACSAFSSLVHIGAPPEFLRKPAIRLLESEEADSRQCAARALTDIEDIDDEILQRLRRIAEEEAELITVLWAVVALERAGESEAAIRRLPEALVARGIGLRLLAAETATRFPQFHAQAIESVREALPHLTDEFDVFRATDVLWRLSEDPRLVEPVLLKLVESNRYVGNAGALLLEVDPDSEPALRALLRAAETDDWWQRLAAAEALGRRPLIPAEARSALLRLAGDDDWRVRAAAAASLNTVAKSPETEAALNRLAGDPYPEVREAASPPPKPPR